jgi:predicted SAM-dependent methyltransferase
LDGEIVVVKLNLGCGDRKIHGFVNIDAREDVNPDVVCDVTNIHKKFSDVDMIYACHVLEHFPTKKSSFQPRTWKEVLNSWFTTLKPGGILRLSVPDFKAACEYFLLTGDFNAVCAFFYGGQKYDFDFHYHGWTFESLSETLSSLGFIDIKYYDWQDTEHFFIDDYSQAYLPHMDKINGKLMSLNIEATKGK